MGTKNTSRRKLADISTDAKGKETTDSKLHRRAQDIVIAAITRGMVADGIVDPTGMDAHELRKKCAELFLENQDGQLWTIIDHTQTLTRHARRFQERNTFEISILLYATACEHWINEVIAALCRRQYLNQRRISTNH
jgi:hypothetical protein